MRKILDTTEGTLSLHGLEGKKVKKSKKNK